MPSSLSNLVLTFLIEHKRRFLLIKRIDTEKNFPNYWAFPGGRAQVGETIVDTIKRKIPGETGLKTKQRFTFLDTYSFKYSTGLTVLLQARSDKVTPNPAEVADFAWVKTLDDLQKYRRIPGIDNHLVTAAKALKANKWIDIKEFELTQDKYLNR
ncbi:MAG: NUDIX hydrolase [bacterium]|nr:NUDIX hydrolase [bacterium]